MVMNKKQTRRQKKKNKNRNLKTLKISYLKKETKGRKEEITNI